MAKGYVNPLSQINPMSTESRARKNIFNEIQDFNFLSSDELNNLGYRHLSALHIESGLFLLERSAAKGNPYAAANLSWALLESGEHERAVCFYIANEQVLIENFETSIRNQDYDRAFQFFNFRSNMSLHFLALGWDESESVALDHWREGSQVGHEESIFYPAVILYQNGSTTKTGEILNRLSDEQLISIKETLEDGLNFKSSWYRLFAQTGLNMISKAAEVDVEAKVTNEAKVTKTLELRATELTSADIGKVVLTIDEFNALEHADYGYEAGDLEVAIRLGFNPDGWSYNETPDPDIDYFKNIDGHDEYDISKFIVNISIGGQWLSDALPEELFIDFDENIGWFVAEWTEAD